MKYFNTLPLIYQSDFNGNYLTVNNIISRAYLLPSLAKNINLTYEYDIKEIDTPENIAYRYYNDVNRYWIVLYANGIMDPQSEWPLTNQQFDLYMVKKYSEAAGSTTPGVVTAYTLGTIHHYEQTVVTSDSSNLQEQTITIQIDKNTYDSGINSTVNATFPNREPNSGIVVTKTTSYNAISIFDYENTANEVKRKISIIKDSFVNEIELQLKSLMSS